MGLFNKAKKRSNVAYHFSSDGKDSHILAGYTPLDRNADVQICVNTYADLVSSMSLQLLKNIKGGDEQVNNELSRVLDVKPNKHQTRKTFFQTVVREAFLKGDGNAVVIPKFSGKYTLESLEVLDMDKVSFSAYENTYKISYQGHELNPDEVLHFVFYPSRECSFIGEGLTPVLKDVVMNVAQGNATKNAFFKSKFAPSVIISVDADSEELMDKDERQKILDSYVGNTEAGKPWLIPANEITVHQVKPLSLRDLALNESLEVERKQIAAAFGIPAFMVGIGDFKRDEYNRFISSTISSIAEVIQQELTKKLIDDDKMYFKFKARSLIQYDLPELTKVGVELVKVGLANRNEVRKWIDMPPSQEEGMNDFSTLENYIKIADLGKQKKLIQDEPSELEGGEN